MPPGTIWYYFLWILGVIVPMAAFSDYPPTLAAIPAVTLQILTFVPSHLMFRAYTGLERVPRAPPQPQSRPGYLNAAGR